MARDPQKDLITLSNSESTNQTTPDRVETYVPFVALEQDILSRIAASDVSALEELLQLYARKLGTIAFAIVGSDDLTEEVVQDVLFKLWEARGKLVIEGNLLHYLARAVRNQALNVARREKSQWNRAENAAHMQESISIVSHNYAVDNLSVEDLRTQVYRALHGVPPRCREIFLMSWEGEMTYAEIAEVLHISLSTVHNQMSKATQRVAEYLRRNHP